MIIITLLLLLLSNSITLRRDKSILYSRVTNTILVISTLIKPGGVIHINLLCTLTILGLFMLTLCNSISNIFYSGNYYRIFFIIPSFLTMYYIIKNVNNISTVNKTYKHTLIKNIPTMFIMLLISIPMYYIIREPATRMLSEINIPSIFVI